MMNEKMYALGSKRSTIREIFEYAKTRSAEIGKENVFDFSIGNPSVPAPACVHATIQKLIAETPSVELHGYTSAQGGKDVRDTIAAVRAINPDIMVLQGAGISGPEDVANVIRAGAQATGCTSGVMKAADPEAAAEEMLYTLRKTWDEVNGK